MPSISQLLFFPIPAIFFLWLLNSLSKTGLTVRGVSWSKDATKWPHTLSRLHNNDLDHVVTKASCFKHFNKTLDAILIPRVPGTESHELVREFIVDEMKQLGWTVEEDTFTDRTPHGRKTFSNIIANLNPDACRHLTLACHYDSLYNREYTFMGATDSAVPCAMLIHAAKMLHMPLKQKSEKDYELSLQFIFFDGEEAFKRWSKTDSLYGSRHLAEKWNKMKAFPTGLNSGSHCTKKEYVSYLDRMDVMVLLDLIGTANPRFYSYFPDTHGLYSQLIEIEKRLNSLGLLDAEPPGSETGYFDSRTILAYVEDDHVPFMRLVTEAITSLLERGRSLLQAIKKYISSYVKVDLKRLTPFNKKHSKRAVVSRSSFQTKRKGASGSFKLSASGQKIMEGVKRAKKPKKESAVPKKPKAASLKKTAKPKANVAKKPAAKKPAAIKPATKACHF